MLMNDDLAGGRAKGFDRADLVGVVECRWSWVILALSCGKSEHNNIIIVSWLPIHTLQVLLHLSIKRILGPGNLIPFDILLVGMTPPSGTRDAHC